MRGLTESEKAIWVRVTTTVRKLGDAPQRVTQGLGPGQLPNYYPEPYDPEIDLHGLTIEEAYRAVLNHILEGANLSHRKLMVITGRSGRINEELPRWVENHPVVRSVESMNRGGAWKLWLKRST